MTNHVLFKESEAPLESGVSATASDGRRRMKYLFYLGHPAHFHMFKHVIAELKQDHDVVLLWQKEGHARYAAGTLAMGIHEHPPGGT